MIMRLLLVLFLFPLLLISRENPFFPAVGEVDMSFSSNITKEYEPLSQATLKLPSTARVLEKVTLSYKNLDGSIETKTVDIMSAIDWHLPIFVSQNYKQTPLNTAQKELPFKKLASLPYIELEARDKEIRLITKDALLRDFLLPKPHRIVCDFKREIDIRAFTKVFSNIKMISKFRIGNHAGYYRVVIELDGYYNYKLQKIKNGYHLKLL